MFSRFKHRGEEKGERGEVLPEANEGPPDSSRRGGCCPRCKKQSSFDVVQSVPLTIDYDRTAHPPDGKPHHTHSDQVSVLICRHCKQGVCVIEEQWVGAALARENKGGGTVWWKGISWWPVPTAVVSSDVPLEVASVFKEASICLSVKCYRATAVMGRTALEAVTVDQGFDTGSLAQRLQRMKDQGHLHPTLSEWAKEVRLIGNAGAHFDPAQDVSKEDADQLMAFLHELLKYTYELPANLVRRRSNQTPP